MPTGDTASASGEPLGSGETDTYSLGQPGGQSLSGIVERQSTAVTVEAVWIDEDGNDVITEQIASAGAGSQATWDVPCRQAKCRLKVNDDGSASGQYSMAAHFR